jgi:hypothetical protein
VVRDRYPQAYATADGYMWRIVTDPERMISLGVGAEIADAWGDAARRVSAIAGGQALFVLSRPWRCGARIETYYVEGEKPLGKPGDWSYTTMPGRAKPLTEFHRRRFVADCKAVGDTPTFAPYHLP